MIFIICSTEFTIIVLVVLLEPKASLAHTNWPHTDKFQKPQIQPAQKRENIWMRTYFPFPHIFQPKDNDDRTLWYKYHIDNSG